MEISHRVYPDLQLVYVRLQGVFEPDGILAMQEEIWSDPSMASYTLLGDLRGLTLMDPSTEELRTLARGETTTLGSRRRKLALVAGKDLHFGLARMFEAFSQTGTMEGSVAVFRAMDEAKAWLGLPPDWVPRT